MDIKRKLVDPVEVEIHEHKHSFWEDIAAFLACVALAIIIILLIMAVSN